MAITHTYCDFASGNDYKGATFTDGAYTDSTKTLVKTGAFAATKVNHWLKLSGTGIVTGYYRVATVSDANTVVLATSAGTDSTDVACTQHDGSTSKPWRSIQGALDLITRDTTNGDQINVKAGTAQVLAATLTLATYGTPTQAVRLCIRGYTNIANDGGVGEINCSNYVMINSSTVCIAFIDMIIGNTLGTNATVGPGSVFANCEIHHSSQALDLYGGALVTGCHFHDVTGDACIYTRNPGGQFIMGNYFNSTALGAVYLVQGNAIVAHNVFRWFGNGNEGPIRSLCGTGILLGNIFYKVSGNPRKAINVLAGSIVINNIIVGFSGAENVGITAASPATAVGNNAFYNNTTNQALGIVIFDLTANDVILAADPFTDAANGDFSLTAAAKTALAAKGWPAAYLGAAGTVPNLNIGPIQMALSSGGGGAVSISPAFGRFL